MQPCRRLHFNPRRHGSYMAAPPPPPERTCVSPSRSASSPTAGSSPLTNSVVAGVPRGFQPPACGTVSNKGIQESSPEYRPSLPGRCWRPTSVAVTKTGLPAADKGHKRLAEPPTCAGPGLALMSCSPQHVGQPRPGAGPLRPSQTSCAFFRASRCRHNQIQRTRDTTMVPDLR